MCGLVAIYGEHVGGREDLHALKRMTTVLRHRGPDDFGYAFAGERVALEWRDDPPRLPVSRGCLMGHRRLSIIDPTPGGRQPFVSRDGRYWLLYNGEIFNYRELRRELETEGYRFHTETDTEVVLSAYAAWGEACFSRFNGMWALLLWDHATSSLVGSRDRFGIKPLFFQRLDGKWLFASEVKALLLYPGARADPNERAVLRYLVSPVSPSGGETFYEHVHAVPPATWFRIDGEGFTEARYWEAPGSSGRLLSDEREAVDAFTHLLRDAVRLRLRADVPVGVTLSGGVDSTSVAQTMLDALRGSEREKENRGYTEVCGFSASFPGSPMDESEKVERFCRGQNVRLHTVRPAEHADVSVLFADYVDSLEAPYFNAVALVNLLLMRRAASEGVKVILNGHGADELFAGYPMEYAPLNVADQIGRLRWRRAAAEARAMQTGFGLGWREAVGNLHPSSRRRRFARALKEGSCVRKEFLGTLRGLLQGEEAWPGHSRLDRRLRQDFSAAILPQWLDLEDRMSMCASVESRLPFLDHRMVELAFSMDDSLKIREGLTKYVVRKAMAGRLPPCIVSDRRKQPFRGPGHRWLRTELRPMMEDLLLSGDAHVYEYVDREAARRTVHGFLETGKGNGRFLWTLLSMEAWMRRFTAREATTVSGRQAD